MLQKAGNWPNLYFHKYEFKIESLFAKLFDSNIGVSDFFIWKTIFTDFIYARKN